MFMVELSDHENTVFYGTFLSIFLLIKAFTYIKSFNPKLEREEQKLLRLSFKWKKRKITGFATDQNMNRRSWALSEVSFGLARSRSMSTYIARDGFLSLDILYKTIDYIYIYIVNDKTRAPISSVSVA